MSGHPLLAAHARSRTARRSRGIRRRGRPQRARRRRADRAARLDGDRRAADQRGLRQRRRAAAAAGRRDRRRAARDGRRRLAVRPPLHRADLHAASARRRRVAAGQLDTRVDIRTGDEFGELGDVVQHDGRPARRAAGRRQAAGAAGDVRPRSPPAWSTTCRIRSRTSATARGCCCATTSTPSRASMFQRTIERELATLKRFMDDLRNIVKPKPIERFAMDVNGVGRRDRRVDARRGRAQRRRASRRTTRDGPLVIDGDRFALGRVYRNLITNAIQATAAGRPRHDRDRARRRPRRDHRHRHRLGHSRRSAVGDLRRLRHDQAPRPRPRPGDLQADRRAARRHDRRRERGRTRHRVHAALPGARRSIGAGGGKLIDGCPAAAGRGRMTCSGRW